MSGERNNAKEREMNCDGDRLQKSRESVVISDYYSMGECAAEPRGNGNGKNL